MKEIFTTFFVCAMITHSFAFEYTVSFTGSGASSTVNSVIVQNLTKGTTATVPSGSTLTLTDIGTSTENIGSTSDFLHVYANINEGIFNLSFNVMQAGVFQINLFNIDGRKMASLTTKLNTGNNSVRISLPKGTFIVKILGEDCNLSKIIISNSTTGIYPTIQSGSESNSSTAKVKQKVKTTGNTVSMTYSTGDQLMYKGISSTYATIITDVPTESKTIDFEFVECKDRDGNNYAVVKIGTQTWMAENLKTTTYKDDIDIPNITDNTAWNNLTTGAYCYYGNDATTYHTLYGCLYNWYAVNTGKLAPAGWHVPTDAEWTTLSDYLGGGDVAGGKMKSTTGWNSPNTGATNSSGFSALPSGCRTYNGSFINTNYEGTWWSSTQTTIDNAWDRVLSFGSSNMPSYVDRKYYGISIRCVKDLLPPP
ncbi:MAG: FISUMP domain-containing protein [Paludibacteraceae bacterium]